MEKYKNKYRIAPSRAQWWNYGWNAAYFITICTKNRAHYFGEITNQKMHLSNTGVLADVFWHEMKNHAISIELDAFVVMPNHIHGILILNGNENEFINSSVGNIDLNVNAGNIENLKENDLTIGQQRFQNQGKNTVSSIVGSYKSAVTKHANRLNLESGWHPRFHDHIIRNDAEFERISNYIENNVLNWKEDKFFKKE
jgi:REP element-mobilizing transposase RayT